MTTPSKGTGKGTGHFTPTPRKGPNGEHWAGRGRKPKWLKALEATQAGTAVTAAPVTEPAVAPTAQAE